MTPIVRLQLARASVWLVCLAPLAMLAERLLHGRLGANPVEFLERALGDWSLRFLLLSLAMTPLRSLTGWVWPLKLRRTVGLWAYAYICLHFAVYIVFDLDILAPAQALAKLGEDLVERLYITVGFTAWLFLLPLAITSTDGWQRRLKRRWKMLHRLIYPAAILAVLHYVWLVKKDLSEPLLYAAILTVLLAWRLPWTWIRGRMGGGILRARSPATDPRDPSFKPRA